MLPGNGARWKPPRVGGVRFSPRGRTSAPCVVRNDQKPRTSGIIARGNASTIALALRFSVIASVLHLRFECAVRVFLQPRRMSGSQVDLGHACNKRLTPKPEPEGGESMRFLAIYRSRETGLPPSPE